MNSRQMLIPLSHWTHSRGVEASLVTVRIEASADLSCEVYTLPIVDKLGSPAEGFVGLGRLAVQAHCLSRYSHYP